MKLCRFDGTRVGIVDGDTVLDVTAVLEKLPSRPWPRPWGDELIAALDILSAEIDSVRASAPRLALAEVVFDSPVARPAKIMAAPANYALHIDESKADAAIAASGPIKPISDLGLFLKASTSLVGFGDGVRLKFPERRTDHEAEFAVVIGKKAVDLDESQALDCVAGYSIGLDITLRGGEERSFRKSIDSYTVLGPWMVTRDEIPDPENVAFQLHVNGVPRQDANTRDLLFGVAKLISLASRFYTLYPGDVLMTGAPAGVGQIHAGDVITVSCEGVGAGTILVA